MEFEVTAIRKRPRTLAEMVGQDFVAATLRNALESGQVAQAYLFSGPRGTGKTSTARILARSLNCESGPTASPCGHCPACVEIGRGVLPDVIEIDGASNTSVNDVRSIKDEVLYAPQSSRKKIYIIDEVHMLSNSAFNALLKTIEEPPPYIVFIFATTEVHKVPATIRSRCQQFRFRLFTPELIRGKLEEAARETGREFDSDALFWIAREAGGSMRDAYTLFDQVLSFSEGRVTLSGIRDKMGLMGLESASELLKAAALGNRKQALDILDDILLSGTAVEQVLAELGDYLRNLMLLACGIEKESLLGASASRFPRELREAWDVRRLELAAEDGLSLYRDIRYSLNPRYELELFIGRLCSLSERMVPEEIVGKIRALRNEIQGKAPAARPLPASAAPPAPAPGAPAFRSRPPQPPEPPQAEPEPPRQPAPPRSAPEPFQPPPSQPEPSCAVKVDIGARPEAMEDGEQITTAVITGVGRQNAALASVLKKAVSWNWENTALRLVFKSAYERDQVYRNGDLIREVAAGAGVTLTELEAVMEHTAPQQSPRENNPRADMVRQVFRGEIVSDTSVKRTEQ